jgi:hypothetical protein
LGDFFPILQFKGMLLIALSSYLINMALLAFMMLAAMWVVKRMRQKP